MQLDLSDYTVAVVNTTNDSQSSLLLNASVYSLENKLLLHKEEKRDAAADAVTDGFKLDLAPLFASDALLLVKLELRNPSGEVVSDNLYWLGEKSASYRHLNRLAPATLSVTTRSNRSHDSARVTVELHNTGTVPSLATKLTLVNATDGTRILPAYYSDNYVSLLPGESHEIEIEYPVKSGTGTPQLTVRGWNLTQKNVSINAAGGS